LRLKEVSSLVQLSIAAETLSEGAGIEMHEIKDRIAKRLRERFAERPPHQPVWGRWVFVCAIVGAIILLIVSRLQIAR
jgi:hypothetical protein